MANLEMFDSMPEETDCFIALEKIMGERLPDPVTFILRSCGFDSFNSLRQIDTASIEAIEQYLHANWDRMRAMLENNPLYRYNERGTMVKLPPGHAAAIRAIPHAIRQKDFARYIYPNRRRANHQMIANSRPVSSRTPNYILIFDLVCIAKGASFR